MPTSTYSHITTVVRYLEAVCPTSILDVGLGNGKMGFIARNFLDVMLGQRYRREDWEVRIDGIEVFGEYIQAHQRAIYDEIYIGDAFDVIDRLSPYDVIILGDVLEHFERPKAEVFLDKCCAHCTKAMILSIPLSERWTQEDLYGNPYERHRSFWQPEEFQARATEFTQFEFACGSYGTFLIRRDDYLHFQVRRRAGQLCEQGRTSEAVKTLETSIRSLSPNVNSYVQLAELFVRQGELALATRWLQDAREACPDYPSIVTLITELNRLSSAA